MQRWVRTIPNNIQANAFYNKEIDSMNVRFAKETDIPQMIDLLLQVGQVHHEIRPDLFRAGAQKYNEEELKALLADPARPIFCCEQDGLMVGYCFCIIEETKGSTVLCDRKVLYIDDLCVDAKVRGAGVAAALYERAVEYAREIGCNAVTLNVWNGNDRAMRFYEKCGLKPYKVCMEKVL